MTLAMLALAAIVATPVPHPGHAGRPSGGDYLPTAADSAVVTVVAGDETAKTALTVLTQGGSDQGDRTAADGGAVRRGTPSVIAVHRDQPTALTFWNLQADDDHDFMLADPNLTVRMKVTLPALHKARYVFTFHREGLYPFYCTMHQPAMSGQILVLPPTAP